MTRTQFTFYESFFKAIRRIKSKAARAEAYDAICAYALWGEEPELDKLPDAAAMAFELIRPNLDASRRKAANGKKGGERKNRPEREEEKSAPGHGAYHNVVLSEEELSRLRQEFPDWQARIERLSAYMAQTGKHYACHYATIRSWARQDAAKGKRPVTSPSREEQERAAIEQMKRMHAHMTAEPPSQGAP